MKTAELSDRELLELAAKANWRGDLANEDVSLRYDESEGGILYLHADNQDHNGCDREFLWNPLTDDGDALRLAVNIPACIVIDNDMQWCGVHLSGNRGKYDLVEQFGNDPDSATRRAIVRAAAEIGKHKQAA